MQARTLLLLGSAALVAFTPATEGFSAPSAGLAHDLARGRMELRPAVRRSSPSCGIRMQAQAEPPQREKVEQWIDRARQTLAEHSRQVAEQAAMVMMVTTK